MSEPIIGSAYHSNGVTVHVHEVKDGMVYYQRFHKGVEVQPFFDELWRKPLATFMSEVVGATLELPHKD